MYTAGESDPEGRLAFEIRAILGRRVPIVAAFDMHAKLTEQLASVLTGLTAYKTAPHVDSYDTGSRAARLMVRVLEQKRTLSMAAIRLPILIAGEKSETDVPPMQHFVDHLRKVESKDGIYAADVLLGFPWADTPHAGVTVSVVGDLNSEQLVHDQARSLAKELWSKRRRFDFTSETCLLPEALRRASLSETKPVIISDSGDNPTAGATGNMAYCLAKAVEESNQVVLISAIADQAAYTEAATIGADARTTLEIGTVTHGGEDPFVWTCTIERLVATRRCNAAIISDGRVTCILTDRRVPTYEPSLIYDCALEPTAFDLLIVKCGYQGPEYRALTERSIVALTPGDSSEDLSELPYQAVPRPIFPLDSGTTFSA
jgi:microcystin degradation protein MlrC